MKDNLEELKKKKMAELQRSYQSAMQQQMQEEAQFEHQVQQLESVVKQMLTREALQRYGNIKAAHPEKAVQLLAVLGQLIQSGRIRENLTDEQLKEILKRMAPAKKEFKINR